MKDVYAPGCALMIYKPELAERIAAFVSEERHPMPLHLTCCHVEPGLPAGTRVINTCPGCDRRYRELYDGITTITLWEKLAASETFPFPDYRGTEMAIHDACPTRTEGRVHEAIRRLAERMNIRVIEPPHTRTHAVCCGDSFFGIVPDAEVKAQMRKRAASMPRTDVIVYCVSCVKSMHNGGRRPRYIVDLLFGEDTEVGTSEPAAWHAEIDEFMALHGGAAAAGR